MSFDAITRQRKAISVGILILKIKSQDATLGRRLVLACQTLGVVFGDVGTSPLYTFSVMFSKAPVNGNEDVLGALSLVLYTLILISLIKYVLIVLWANDDGEGISPFELFLYTMPLLAIKICMLLFTL